MIAPIFNNPEHQERFDREGFLTVQFLTPEDVQKLLDIFYELHPEIEFNGFYSSSYSGDFAYKKEVSDRVTEIFQPHFERIFKNYSAFGSAFLAKTPTDNSELAIHQDWTIVDEEKYVAINCWVPLTDIDETNGGLQVIPGSHYPNFKSLRAPTLPFFFTGNDTLAVKSSQPIYVKAGQAVILNQSLVHFSPPNHSDKIRIAITSGIKSKGAPMMFHYKDNEQPEKDIEVYAMEENFLINFDNFFQDIFKPPVNGEKVGTRDYPVRLYEKEEVLAQLNKMRSSAGYALATTVIGEEPATVEATEPAFQEQTEEQAPVPKPVVEVIEAPAKKGLLDKLFSLFKS